MDGGRKTSAEIAMILSISENTVNFHRKTCRKKSMHQIRPRWPVTRRYWLNLIAFLSACQMQKPAKGTLSAGFILLTVGLFNLLNVLENTAAWVSSSISASCFSTLTSRGPRQLVPSPAASASARFQAGDFICQFLIILGSRKIGVLIYFPRHVAMKICGEKC